MNQYNAIDLFCGAGGLSYGFECAGFNILLELIMTRRRLKYLRETIRVLKVFAEILLK